MKSKFTLVILFSLTWMCSTISAQAPVIEWQKCLGGSSGENANSIEQTADSGFIVSGYTLSNNGNVSGNHGNYDYWVVKLNESGGLVWQKCLGGSDIDEGYSVHQTLQGEFIVSGQSSSTDGDVSGNHGGYDFWVAKLDSAGGLLWQKSFGGSADEVSYSTLQTSDGGFIISGYTHSDNGDVSGIHGSDDCWVVKLNNDGILQWQKCLGGTNSEYARDIKETNDHGFILAASSSSNDGDVSLNYGNNDYWIVKLDSVGNIIWEKVYGGSSQDNPKSIQQTVDGGYIVAGSSNSTDGDVSVNLGSTDYWILKLDSAGNLVWQKSLGGSLGDYANSVQQTSDGFIVAGRSFSDDGDVTGHYGLADFWVVQMDSTGNIEWQKSLGGTNNDEALSLTLTIDSGIVITGNSSSNNNDVSGNHGNGDIWIVKLNPHCHLYYSDDDNDGFGDALNDVISCTGIPSGYVINDLDCDDADAAVHPLAIEVCNNIDDNCNGQIDDGVGSVFYADTDGDGYGIPAVTTLACSQPAGYVSDHTDCDDSNDQINPGAYEICNGIDDNCNNLIDDGLPIFAFYFDADGDGYGNPLLIDSACGAPLGFVADNTDCDDTNANIYPGAQEIPNNGIDDNCNGAIDEFGTGIYSPYTLANFSIYPNPAHDQTAIHFTLSQSSHIYIKVYDLDGKEIITVLYNLGQGEHSLQLNTNQLSNGVYMLKIIGDFATANQKLIVQ